jgi:hypothetical protein
MPRSREWGARTKLLQAGSARTGRAWISPVVWLALAILVLGLVLPQESSGGAATLSGSTHLRESVGKISLSSTQFRAGTPAHTSGILPLPGDAPLAGSSPQWVNITQALGNQPPPRSNASVAWDPTDGEYLLFGGEAGGRVLGDTWVFHDGSWSPVHSSLNPAARYGAGLVYDPVDNYTVLFGGSNSTTRMGSTVNDTWYFAQGEWTRLTPTTPPRGRAFPSMAYDPTAGRVVMFGGLLFQNQSASTWGYIAGNWSNLVSGGPSEPPDRMGGAMAFDTAANTLLLFGGLDPETRIPLTLNDTWSFHWTGPPVTGTGNWTNLNLSVAPSTRYDMAMAYDASEGAIVLFGGSTVSGAPLADTWTWTLLGWSRLSFTVGSQSPTVRYGAALAPSPTPGVTPNSANPPLLLFGGVGRGGQLLEDSWFFGSLPLAVLPPKIDRPNLDVGTRGTVSLLAFGGVAPYTYSWNLLPPGCPSSNHTTLTCSPSVANTYQISATVKDAAGASMTSAATPWVVAGPPSVSAFTLLPSPALVSQRVSVNVTVTGGSAPYSFRFAGLPPGCNSQNLSAFSCFPQSTGSFAVTVNITDADNLSASAHTTLSVSVTVTGGTALWEYAVEGLLLLALLGVVIYILRRKRRAPDPGVTPWTPPAAGSAPAPGSVSPPPRAPPG